MQHLVKREKDIAVQFADQHGDNMSGNPFFGKTDNKAFHEACEESIENRVARMKELHHTDYKPQKRKARK